MIDINVSLFIQMANFLVLLLLLNIVLFKPIRAIIRQRKEKMEGLAADADKFRQRYEEASEDLKAVIRDARSEGMQRLNDLKNQAYEQEKALLAKVNEEMEAESAKILASVREQIAGTRQSLLEQVDGFSVALAEKILGRSLS